MMTHDQLLTHGQFLRRLALSLVSDPNEADDLVQKTWLSAMEARPTKLRSPRAWLRTVALNVVRGDHRRAQYQASRELPERASDPDPAELYLRKQTTQQLVEAVFELQESEREVVLLRFFEGLKPGEIADHLDVPRETVRTRLRRALERLRVRLDAEHNGNRSAWVLALSPITGLRPALASGAATSEAVAPTFAVSFGGAKFAMIAGVIALAWAGHWFLNREEPLDIEISPETSVAEADSVEQPSRSRLTHPPQEQVVADKNEVAPKEEEASRPEEVVDDAKEIICDVVGRAVDQDGNPVVNARIEICSTNGANKRIAESYSDSKGYFRFGEKTVPPQTQGAKHGTVTVFGTAPGYGFAWHGMRMIYRGKRAADDEPDDSYYRGEECVMNLVFHRAQTLEGTVVDENGDPVADVDVEVESCDFIDTKGKHRHVNFREFWGLNYLPENRRRTKTNHRGDFKIPEVPREMVLILSFQQQQGASRMAVAVTTDRDLKTLDIKPNITGSKDTVVQSCPMKITMPSTRRLNIRCLHPSSGAPIAAARVHAFRRGPDRQSAWGKTNAQGEVELSLPLGEFRICIDPPKDSELVRSYHEVEILGDQDLVLKLHKSAIVIFEAVDAVTKKPISGASFALIDAKGGRQIQSNLSIVDHPKTGEDGRMRALMKPGPAKIILGWSLVPGYRPPPHPREVELRPGETHTVRFELTPLTD